MGGYSDTAAGWMENPEPVNRATAIAWIKQHDGDPNEFFEDAGDQEFYSSEEVFAWLGY